MGQAHHARGIADPGEFPLAPGVARGDLFALLKSHLDALQRRPAHGNRTLHYYELLVALLLSAYEPTVRSLRTLDDASVSQRFMQDRLGNKRLAKSTLSDAMASMDASALLPCLKRLLAQVPNLPRRDSDLAALGRILAVDGSFFRVPAEVFWAINSKRSNGKHAKEVRLNLQLDVLQFVPAGVSISGQDGASEGAAILAQGVIAGAVYLADRGYVHMEFIRGVLAAGADLVVRVMHNTCFEARYSQPLDPEDKEAQVLSDTIGIMPRAGQQHLRIVEVYDARNKKTVRLLTSLLDVPAHVIAKLYRYRWMIELFFRWLKCTARIRHLMSNSQNGITLQFYAAMIAVLAGYLVTGVRPGLYEYNMLCGALRGTVSTQGMLEVLARRSRERELEKARRARKKSA
ncbi:MAG TPA: IS4 family transposase [Phycisphaerae bacterium]|nr:IS4 family transposase [Phycisphaerae bacterium]